MSRAKNLPVYQNITAGDMSTASITSAVTSIQYMDDVGLQLNWSGAPVGTFQVQVSMDYSQDLSSPANVTNAGNWVPLTLTYWDGAAFVTGVDIPTSVGSPIYIDLALLSAPWMRAVYTRVSGSGTLSGYVAAKQLGG